MGLVGWSGEPAVEATSPTVSYTFDSGSGSITVPSATSYVTVEIWGGGGGGSGGGLITLSLGSYTATGGGGGGGGYSIKTWSSPAGGTLTYTVGNGGNGGNSITTSRGTAWAGTLNLNSGDSGGTSQVDFDSDTLIADGGGGGGGTHVSNITTLYINSTKGTAGTASGGDTDMSGQEGGAASPASFSGAVTLHAGVGGNGANGGNGGTAPSMSSGGATGGVAGGAGNAFGGGGGSGIGNAKGGNGASGRVKITIGSPYDITITDASPSSGSFSGGTTLTITGTDLNGTTAVTVGGVNCQSFTVIDNETVECTTPAGTMGTDVDVALTSYGVTETMVGAFRYENQPILSSVDVGVAPPAGSPAVRYMSHNAQTSNVRFSILGVGLTDVEQVLLSRGGTTITIDDTLCVVSNDTTVGCYITIANSELLGLTAGVYDVSVKYGSGVSSNVLVDALELIEVDFEPRAGLVYGGGTVSFSGAGLGARATANSYAINVLDSDWVNITTTCVVAGSDEIKCTMPARNKGTALVWFRTILSGGMSDYIMWNYEYKEPSISLSLIDDDEAVTDTVAIAGSVGALLAEHLTARVVTDNPTGYDLSVSAGEPRLKCAVSDDYIEPLSAVGAMVENHWGYGLGLGLPSSWAGVTSTPAVFKSLGSATGLNGDDTVVWFGTMVNTSLPACSYGGTLTFSVVMRP